MLDELADTNASGRPTAIVGRLPPTAMAPPQYPGRHIPAPDGSRCRAWRVAAYAFAASLVTAAGLGPLSRGALGANAPASSPTSTVGAPTPPPTSSSGVGAPKAGTGQPPTTSATTPSPASSPAGQPESGPVLADPGAPAASPASPTATSKAPSGVQRRRKKTTARRKVRRRVAAKHPRPAKRRAGAPQKAAPASKHSAPPPANGVAPPPQLVAAQARALAAELAGSAASAEALSFYRIPPFLLPIYQAASLRYGVPWQILAAINEVETDYGNDLSVSTAGAVGWMQFMPETWLQYGVDALNAGYADPYNPVDAIFAAARYLRAAGASSNLGAAILAYNHSQDYVNSVLLRAKLIATYPKLVIATLTGVVDGRPPVTGRQVAWGSLGPVTSSGATARVPSLAGEAAGRSTPASPGSSAPPTPTAAAAAAAGTAEIAQAPELVDVMSTPNAAVVAVQDGRILSLGSSRKLGRYVILRDVYGDVFTYADLGSIARSYRPPRAPCLVPALPPTAADAGAGAQGHVPASLQPAADAGDLPLTLAVKTPGRHAAAVAARSEGCSAGTAGGELPPPAGSSKSPAAGSGKARLYAHPGNPDELAADATAAADGAERLNPRSVHAGNSLLLRRGSLVTRGTVLGHVRRPLGARDGHLRFAIRPAGDQNTIDPRPILQSWVQLDAALHPQGASEEADMVGATASGVFLLSESELERAVLSDPDISLSGCWSRDVASGATDKRVLAVLAFLSRVGLKPTVSGLHCVSSLQAVSADASTRQAGDAVDISRINGIPIAGHQGAGSVTDRTIRTLLTFKGEFMPHEIISLMRYPGASNTLARAEEWDEIRIGFRPAGATVRLGRAAPATSTPGSAQAASSAPDLSGHLSSAQWNKLITRIVGLRAPTVAVTPSSSAIRDRRAW